MYLYNIFRSKKKWRVGSCYNMGDPWEYYAMWKEKQSQRTEDAKILFIWNAQNKQIIETESGAVLA